MKNKRKQQKAPAKIGHWEEKNRTSWHFFPLDFRQNLFPLQLHEEWIALPQGFSKDSFETEEILHFLTF